MRRSLIEIVGHAAIDLGELRLPADLVRARLVAGVPLLDRLDLPIPPSAAALVERLTVAMLAGSTTRDEAEELLGALHGRRVSAEQLVGEAVVGHDEHLGILATSANLSLALVRTVADLGARAVLGAVAIRLRSALSLAPWGRGYCPICGGRALLAERAPDRSPAIALRCGRCATSWAYDEGRCPDCQTGCLDVVELGDAAEAAGWQFAECFACASYLKHAPSARAGRLADLLLDDLESWRLDRLAVERGRERPPGPGYRLEHGEPGGEELDDE